MSIHEATQRVADCMDQILTNFKDGANITVLVRYPEKPNADFCLTDDDLDEVIAMIQRRKGEAPPQTNLRARPAKAEDVNKAFDPANEALGGAFMAGFREGWIYAEIDADGERYQEMAEEYALAVDIAPQEAWDAHRAKFFAMLPLAAIPEVGAPIADIEAEIASVVQSVNEWDDRTSPDDYPDHLLITSEELTDILRNFAGTIAIAQEVNRDPA